MIKNNAGLTPLQLSIKKHNYTITLMYIKYLNLDINDLLELKNMNINKEFDDFMYSYDSGILNENQKKLEEKFTNIKYFISQKETIPKEYKENFKEEF